MYKNNDGTGDANILQNHFTAYLVTAIKNSRIQYLRREQKWRKNEMPMENMDYAAKDQVELDMICSMPVLSQLEDERLAEVFKRQKERDLYIFFAKILEERTFVEIAVELGIGYKAVTMSYYRMVNRIKKEFMKGDKDEF